MRRIGIVLFDDVSALDVTGPADAFATARTDDAFTRRFGIWPAVYRARFESAVQS